MKDTDHHDGVLERLMEDEVVAEPRHHEPPDLRVTRRGVADVWSKLAMLRQEVGSVENGLADTFRGFGIVASDETAVPVQIASVLWTEPRPDHDRRRNSSVVLD